MHLRSFLNALRTPWKLVTVCALLGVLAALGASLLATPQYQSQTTLFLSQTNARRDVGTAFSGSLFTQQLARSLVGAVTGEKATSAVAAEVGGGLTSSDVTGKLSATNPLDTSLIKITATDPDPVRAQQIAESAAVHFSYVALEFASPKLTKPLPIRDPVIWINTVQYASLPTSPATPRVTLNLAIGLLVGLAIGVGAAGLMLLLSGPRKGRSTDGAAPQPA